MHIEKLKVESMLILFFDCQKVITVEWLFYDQKVLPDAHEKTATENLEEKTRTLATPKLATASGQYSLTQKISVTGFF